MPDTQDTTRRSFDHNSASLRVVSILEGDGVEVMELGSDVWAINPGELAAAKALIPNQPHFNYYLARDVRASQFYVGPSKVWVIHIGPGTAKAPMANMWAAHMKKSVTTSVFFPQAEEVNVYSMTGAASRVECKSFYPYVFGGVHSETFMIDRATVSEVKVRASVEYTEGKFGSLIVGEHFRFWTDYGASSDIRSEDDVLSEPYPGYIPPGQTRDGKKAWASAPGERQIRGLSLTAQDRPDDLLKDMVVFCGPPCVDYGEIYPDFTWFGAKATTLVTRMRAVINGTKSRINGSPAKVEQALTNFENSGAVIYSFKTDGTRDLDPIDFLPQTKRLIRSFGSIRPNGAEVTEASIEKGLTDFYSKKWLVSAINHTNVASAILSTASKATSATIRTSSLSEAHLSDGAGTINVSFDQLTPIVTGMLKGGATIDFQDGNFAAQEGFDAEGWQALKQLRAPEPGMTEPEQVQGPAPDFGTSEFANLFGEGLIARLATANLFDKDEELLLLPLLSPQFMWTRFARDSVNPPVTQAQMAAVLDPAETP